MIVLGVTWIADEGKESEVIKVFGKLAAASRSEPGCLMYVVHQSVEDPRWFFVYEQYRDEAALEAHRQSPHFQQYARQELPKLGKRLEGRLMRPIPEPLDRKPIEKPTGLA